MFLSDSKKGGIFNTIPLLAIVSWISNSLSAIIRSPGSSKSSNPDFSVNCLSHICPPHASDIKLTSPAGVHPTSTFQVLQLLYCEYITDEFINAEGHWHYARAPEIINTLGHPL